MKNNLVPTRIVNKNGVHTTVHKRVTDSKWDATKLPAPHLNVPASSRATLSPEERASMVDDLATRFYQSVYPTDIFPDFVDENHPMMGPFREQLAKYSDDLIEKLHTAAELTGNRISGTFLLAREMKSEQYLLTYIALHGEDYERIFDVGRGYSFNLPDAVASMPTYPQLHFENTDDYYRKATALTGVVATIQHKVPHESHWNDHDLGRFIIYTPAPKWGREQLARLASDDLIDLILETPEQWERIADIIVSRNTDDAKLIRSIITHESSAVSEGTL